MQSKKYHYFLLILYILIWIFLAIKPLNRFDWFLENLLPFIFVPLLVITYKRFRMSNLSYTLITVFMILHAVGAHYTYSEVPFIKSMFNILHFQRVNYDRLVHFLFGLFMVYPTREVIAKNAKIKGIWSYYLPIAVIMSFSAAYEIIEWATAVIVQPQNAIAWLGIQEDVFDAEKDMLMAAIGTFITMLVAFARDKAK